MVYPYMKAISPVIATVIIVAVAIAISIAVALWLTGIVGGFTTVENLQITYAYANYTTNESVAYWNVTLRIENKGTATATIDQIFVNGVPISYGPAKNDTIAHNISTTTLSIGAGESKVIEIYIGKNKATPGQQVEIKIHTASGKEYPKMITLP